MTVKHQSNVIVVKDVTMLHFVATDKGLARLLIIRAEGKEIGLQIFQKTGRAGFSNRQL